MTYLDTLTRDWSAFSAEVATNRTLANRLMRVVEFATMPPAADALEADIRAAEVRIVMGLIGNEVRARSEGR